MAKPTQDFFIMENLKTGEIRKLAIPNSFYGEIIFQVIEIFATIEEKNLFLFRKDGISPSFRAINKALKTLNMPVHFLTGITQTGNRQKITLVREIEKE